MKNELLISQQARDLGKKLIRELNINDGYELANLLGVNSCYDNHQTVLIWTFHQIEEEPLLKDLIKIKKVFLSFFPESAYQLA
ncbi:hypothetical protein [Acinetobacter soli]|uniref:hypothetical protein n=1 Tax=Acinetobacter soli TaxID=487316 RepID=UPI000E5B4092|nr:hypothetical protein [Acinetobacter soli]